MLFSYVIIVTLNAIGNKSLMINNLFGISPNIKGNIDELVESYKNLNIEQSVSKMRSDGVADAEIRAVLAKQKYTEVDIQQAMANATSNAEKTKDVALTNAQIVGYKLLAGAKKAAGIAGSVLFGVVVSLISTKFISWISDVANKAENMAKKAEEATQKMKELNESISSKKKSIEELGKRYAELSQYIDTFTGKNISLSNEDYNEFLSISNELSELFPSLDKIYDSNGNAIVRLSGNVDQITSKLELLLETEKALNNIQILKGASDKFEDIYSKSEKYNDTITTNKNLETFYKKRLNNGGLDELKENYSELLKGKVQSITSTNLLEYQTIIDDYSKLLDDLGVKYDIPSLTQKLVGYDNQGKPISEYSTTVNIIEKDFEYTENALNTSFESLINTYKKNIDKLSKEIKQAEQNNRSNWSSMNGFLIAAIEEEDDSYKIMSDNTKATVQNILNSIKWEDFGELKWEDMKKYVSENIISALSDVNIANDLETLFNQDLSKLSPESAKKIIDGYIENIANILQKSRDEIIKMFGLNNIVSDSTNLFNSYNNTIDGIAKKVAGTSDIEIVNSRGEAHNYNDIRNQIDAFANQYAINTQDEIAYFNKTFEQVNYDIDKAFDLYLNGKLEDFNLASYKDDIDKFQSDIDTLHNALVGVGNETITDGELLDLAQEFTSLDITSNTLSDDIKALIRDALQNLFEIMGNPPEELKNILEKMADNAIDAKEEIKDLSTALSDLQSSHDLLKEIKGDMLTGGISVSNLQKIIDTYPALTTAVAEYNAGLISEAELYNKLEEQYEQDYKAAKKSNVEKLATSTLFYNKVIEGESEKVKKINDIYDIELGNFKSLADAKFGVEKELLSKLSKEWAKFYNIKQNEDGTYYAEGTNAGKSFEELNEFETTGNKSTVPTAELEYKSRAMADLKGKLDPFKEQYNNAKAGTDDIVKQLNDFNAGLDDLFLDYGDFNLDLDDYNGDDGNKGKNRIDWAENSISNLSNEIDKLNSKLEDGKLTYSEQSDILDNIISKQEDLVDLKEDAVGTYETDYENALAGLGSDASKYKELIESNTEFSIESFDNDEAMFNKVSEAQSKWEKYQQALSDYEESVKDLSEKQEQRYTKRQEKLDGYIQINNNSKQDYQNKIDEAYAMDEYGSTINPSWYENMISYNEENLRTLKSKLQNAIDNRNTFDYGTPGWIEADNEVQEIEDNISELTNEQLELNRAMLALPINKLKQERDELEKQLDLVQEKKEIIEASISSASNIVQGQIDYYNDLKKATSDSYDSQIEEIQKQKDALTESNDEIQKQIDLEKAQYDLERARNQKNVKVLRNGKFIYEADQEAIRDAQKTLDDKKFDVAVDVLDKQIKNLQDKKDEALKVVDAQIESLQAYKDEIDQISSKFEEMLNLQKLTTKYGTDIVDRIMNGDLSVINLLTADYNEIAIEEETLEQSIKQYDKDIEAIETLAKSWDETKGSIESYKKIIDNIVNNNITEIKKIDERSKAVGNMATSWSKTKLSIQESLNLINTSHDEAIVKEKTQLENRLKNIQSFATEALAALQTVKDALNDAQSSVAEGSLPVVTTSTSSSSSTSTTSYGAGNNPVKTINFAKKNHKGLELGYIGEKSSNDKDAFKYIALSELKPDEVPRILQIDEAVLTKLQQSNIMNNMRTSFVSGIQQSYIPSMKESIVQRNYAINGDIILNGVNDTHTLAKSISLNFLSRLDQELYRNK